MFLPSNITLQFGDTGDFVAEMQRRLSIINLFNEAFINATFDSNTVNAVKSFQSMQGLRVDGVAGPETLRRLNGVISGDTSSSSSSDNKQEEERIQTTSLAKDMTFEQLSTPALDPMALGAATTEEKPVEKPVEKPAVAAPPPRMDGPTPQELQAQQQQQQMDAFKQQELARQQQQQQPTPEELQARLQQQQAEMQKLQEQIKQQQLGQEAKQKPPEPPKPTEQQLASKEETQQTERRPLSAMLQKLVDYIESKLPRSVVDEVKAIGQTMTRAGVREAPEAGAAGPAGPAIEAGRGAQQQQQRG